MRVVSNLVQWSPNPLPRPINLNLKLTDLNMSSFGQGNSDLSNVALLDLMEDLRACRINGLLIQMKVLHNSVFSLNSRTRSKTQLRYILGMGVFSRLGGPSNGL